MADQFVARLPTALVKDRLGSSYKPRYLKKILNCKLTAITITAFKHSDVVSLRQPARYCV